MIYTYSTTRCWLPILPAYFGNPKLFLLHVFRKMQCSLFDAFIGNTITVHFEKKLMIYLTYRPNTWNTKQHTKPLVIVMEDIDSDVTGRLHACKKRQFFQNLNLIKLPLSQKGLPKIHGTI